VGHDEAIEVAAIEDERSVLRIHDAADEAILRALVVHDLRELLRWKEADAVVGGHDDAEERVQKLPARSARPLEEEKAMPSIVRVHRARE
jgi:hypothetical protein